MFEHGWEALALTYEILLEGPVCHSGTFHVSILMLCNNMRYYLIRLSAPQDWLCSNLFGDWHGEQLTF